MAVQPTITDVARRAKVSPTTVSHVLNEHPQARVSASTRARVLEAAGALGYAANALARGLATGKTRTIGLFTPMLTDAHYAKMLGAVEAKARALKYHLLVSTEADDFVRQGRVDGVVAIGLPTMGYLAALLREKPTVYVCNRSESPSTNYIGWSDFESTHGVGRYLIGLGHRRIAMLVGDTPADVAQPEKVMGFRKAIEEQGLAWSEYRGTRSADPIQNGCLLTRELLDAGDGITAIFARNDSLAVGGIEALREAGVAVPRQVSVVGYNDTPLACSTYPKLTTVRTPIAEAGEMALERLAQLLEGEATSFPALMLPTERVERDSCAPPP